MGCPGGDELRNRTDWLPARRVACVGHLGGHILGRYVIHRDWAIAEEGTLRGRDPTQGGTLGVAETGGSHGRVREIYWRSSGVR